MNKISQKEHIDYIMKKSARTMARWEKIMQAKGRIDDNSFSDSEESTPIETDTKFSENTKNTKDIPTTNQDVPSQQRIEKFLDEVFD